MRILVLQVFANLILLFVPVVGGLIGLIAGRFLRVSPVILRRLVGGGVLLGSPCLSHGPVGWRLEPLAHVALEQLSGRVSLVNVGSVLLVTLLVGVGYLVVERKLNASSKKGSRS